DCGETASSSEGNEHAPQQAADRDERGERHEAGYNSETRIHTNQPTLAPADGERRSDRDSRERVSESRESRQNADRDSARADSERKSGGRANAESKPAQTTDS